MASEGVIPACPESVLYQSYWLQEDSGQAGMTTSMLSTGKPEEPKFLQARRLIYVYRMLVVN